MSQQAAFKDHSDEECGSVDDASRSSPKQTSSTKSRIISRTSTEEYEHTPFDQFILQVKELCQILWPSSSPAPLPSRNFFQAILRPKKPSPARKPSTLPIDFVIERLPGGGFNRIIGVTTVQNGHDPSRYILRVPRYDYAQHDREIAVLRFVRQQTIIPVPDVIFVDFTSANPLKERYSIQSRIVGHDLQQESPNYYPNLTHEQKCAVAKQLAEIFLELQDVSHPYPGIIKEAPTSRDTERAFNIHPFELSDSAEIDLATHWPPLQTRPFDPDWKPPDKKAFRESSYYFLITQFGRWRARELRLDPASIGWMHYFDQLATAAKQMDDMGFLGIDENCLCHLDLNSAPRNIMTDIDADGTLKISGILDWDSAILAPIFVGCAPPMWLWAWSFDDDEDERHANDLPATSEQQEIKRIFEETVGPLFLIWAYPTEYRLARELFRFAMQGLPSSTHMEEAERFLAEWNELFEMHKRKFETGSAEQQKSSSMTDAVAEGGSIEERATSEDTSVQ